MEQIISKKRRPFGFYVCSIGFTFERIAFYSIKWLIAIWLALEVQKGGLGLSAFDGAKMSGFFVSFTYITPLIGGYVADHWVSPRLCVTAGMFIMGIGYLCGWQATSKTMVWVMILLVAIGTGLFKGNLSGVNGQLFDNQNELDSAFSIQYSFVNLGSFIGTTTVAFIAQAVSYNFVFLICAILLFADTIWFTIGGAKFLRNAGIKPFKIDERKYTTAKTTSSNGSELQPLTLLDKKRIGAIILVTFFSILFWIVWYLAYMPVYYHWGPDFANHADWTIGQFVIPSAWFDSLNALTCIILGPVLSTVWAKLSNRPQGDLSMFKKTALGMILVGASFGVMAIADIARGTGQANIAWLVAVAILMSIGEMVFSPLGNSFINKFSPAKLLGLLLGVWPIAVFFATSVYGYLYELLSKFRFVPAYTTVAVIVALCGVILWVFDHRFNRLVASEEE